jgi:ribosomal protein S18 acetylase RimI-like enzyme
MNINIRRATQKDLPEIIRLLVNDPIGVKRESYLDPLPESYCAAFAEIEADKNQLLVVAEIATEIVATLQLTFITYLTYQGGKRAQIEGVHVKQNYRSKGIGAQLLAWAIAQARQHHCKLIQLTSSKERTRSIQFYQRLGFQVTHEGLKLML